MNLIAEFLLRRKWSRRGLWALASVIASVIVATDLLVWGAWTHSSQLLVKAEVCLVLLLTPAAVALAASIVQRPSPPYRFVYARTGEDGVVRITAADLGAFLLTFGGTGITVKQRRAQVSAELVGVFNHFVSRGCAMEITTELIDERKWRRLQCAGFRERRYGVFFILHAAIPWLIIGPTILLMASMTGARVGGLFRTYVRSASGGSQSSPALSAAQY